MEGLKMWLLAMTAAALLAGAVEQLCPDGPVKRAVRLVCGLVLLVTMLRPAAQLRDLAWGDLFSMEREAAQESVEQGTQMGAEQMSAIIAEEAGAYIVDKAAEMGIQCAAQVFCSETEEGLILPQAVEVAGEMTAQQRQDLTELISGELGIPAEEQSYRQGGEES